MNRHSTHCRRSPSFLSFVFPLLFALGAAGCAAGNSTKRYMTSFIDPEFFGRPFARLAAHYETNELDYRSAIEEGLVKALNDRKAFAMQSTGFILPTRSTDSTTIRITLMGAGFDGYLRIREVDRWTDTYHVPSQEKTVVKREIEEKKVPDRHRRGEQRADSVVRITETETATTTTTGGYTGEATVRRFNIELIHLPTGKTAWLATGTIYGSVIANAPSFGKMIASQLVQDGMVVLSD